MKKIYLLVGFFLSFYVQGQLTYCNPMDLNYNYQNTQKDAYREAADPTVINFKGIYYLFASKSGGYWSSKNLKDWKYIASGTLPVEDYAPTALVVKDNVYFMACSYKNNQFYYTDDPSTDNWKKMEGSLPFPVLDPALYMDDDGKKYLYYGLSNTQPIKAVPLDDKFMPTEEPKVVIDHFPEKHGFEVFAESRGKLRKGFNEGSWMNKYNGKYYLQFASPATEKREYADGVYTAVSPMGPFTYEPYSPFSYRPSGFVTGTGHGCTFADSYGNYWHMSCITISVRHKFERRIGMFPASFDNDGVMRTYTAFGDYPIMLPNKKVKKGKENLFRGWMLLSFNKESKASSSIQDYGNELAFDEDIRTWWAAKSGSKGEYIAVDLGSECRVNALQLNFADHGVTTESIEYAKKKSYQYKIYGSSDNTNWKIIADYSQNEKDACHQYIELQKASKVRYLKVVNCRDVAGNFSFYDVRVFGIRKGKKPEMPMKLKVVTNSKADRKAQLSWDRVSDATGYIVNYGTSRDKLYTQVMVYDATTLELSGLNSDTPYFFSVDAFNESGITYGNYNVTPVKDL